MTTDNPNTDPPAQAPDPDPTAGNAEAADDELMTVVAIGASAGGLEAFRELFSHLPADTGMAFVVIQHMAPHSSSVLTDILQRETGMPVIAVDSGMEVRPNQVYVMLPTGDMLIENARLRPIQRRDTKLHLPIDTFFSSLAEDLGNRAVGVILSGTASDGVIGLKRIRDAGGLTFAQTPETARYPDMPRSAIAAHCVDFIRSPAQIAGELARLAPHGLDGGPEDGHRPSSEIPDLGPILHLLRRATGHDFSYYKRTTLQRRIERQMAQKNITSLEEYTRLLETHPDEVTRLFEEILINVTAFFRDPEIFDYLRNRIFPALLDRLPQNEALRIWVPGCSSGEEVYSLAICLLETLQQLDRQVPIKIFASDIDEQAVALAREGYYSARIAEQLTPRQLEQHFTPEEGGYRIKRTIRELCVFAVHNVVTEPPFSRIDLISCRNLLIYLGQILQKKLIPLFHYALRPGGYLLLGKSETIGRHADLFTAADKNYKIYRKVNVTSPPLELPGNLAPAGIARLSEPVTPNEPQPTGTTVDKQIDHLLLDKYAPPGVLIDENMNILQFRGQLGDYLEPAPGRATLNLLRMARDPLVPELRAAVVKAVNEGEAVVREGVRLESRDRMLELDLTVIPVRQGSEPAARYLVLFEATGTESAVDDGTAEQTPADPREVTRLREELAATKEYLHSVIEQQEIAYEEARSANEETQASNEELQSINEELETAKEELQSSNEELATVNDELDTRNRELQRANDDMQNLINSVNIPLVMVGSDLTIRLFTPFASKAFSLIPEDTGRPITDLSQKIPVADLDQHLLDVIQTLEPYRREVRDSDGHWYELNIRPYRTADNRIDGAVMVFVDINSIRRSLQATTQAQDFSREVVAAMHEPLLVLDQQQYVREVSDICLGLFDMPREKVIDSPVQQLGGIDWSEPGLRTALQRAAEAGEAFSGIEVDHPGMGGGRLLISGQPLHLDPGQPPYVLVQFHPQP